MRLPSQPLLWAVSLGHLANDMFMSMRAVVLTFISSYVLPMGSQQIGLAVSAIELTGALSQPFFGRRADRTGGRVLGAGGVAWTVSMMLLGFGLGALTKNFWLLVIPMALAGLGSGAFHPVGSMHAADSSPMQAGRNTALFFLAGQLGLAISPALAGALLDNTRTHLNDTFGVALGPAALPLIERGSVWPLFSLGLVAIPAVIWMLATIPRRTAPPRARQAAAITGGAIMLPKVALAIFALAVALRSFGHLAVVNFIPYLFQAKGWSPAEYGALASSFWAASGFAGVWFGGLADRYDARRVVLVSLLITAIPIFILPDANGAAAVALAVLIGAMSGTHSLIVILAQALLPGQKGFASGLILGYIFATGALASIVVGSLIESLGAANSFHLIGLLTLLSAPLWLRLPSLRRAPQAATS